MLASLQRRCFSSSVQPLRFGALFAPTRRDPPADATLPSHQLLIRAGFIRMTSGRGLYTILPLGLRVLQKITAIIDEELHASGCQKLEMPLLLQAEDWQKTGRWDSTGEEVRYSWVGGCSRVFLTHLVVCPLPLSPVVSLAR